MARKYFTKWDEEKQGQLGLRPDKELAALWGVPVTIVTHRRNALRVRSWPARVNQDLIHDGLRICYQCKQEQPISEFTPFKKCYDGLLTQCKTCVGKKRRVRRHKRKQALVDRMGGQCSRCGYSEATAVLEFHHIDPTGKEWNLSAFNDAGRKRETEILEELNRCALLCSNCHRGLHSGEIEIEFSKRDTLGWEVTNDCDI